MKPKILYLVFLHYIIFFPSYAHQNSFNISPNYDSIKEKKIEIKSASSDTIVEKEAIRTIMQFYKGYTNSFLSGNSSTKDHLKKRFLTKSLIDKVDRIAAATDADPIIRAQDFSQEAIETLKVRPLGQSWYMVSYILGRKYNSTNIPVRINKIKGKYMIDYIMPDWNGSLYGDHLLCDNTITNDIDTSEPLSFLKSFYDAYTMKYCTMSETMSAQLHALRKKYLTLDVLKQFDAAREEQKVDGRSGYDLLIDGFDFDCLWRSSIKISKLDKGNYQVDYTKGKRCCSIILKISKRGERYQISDISKNKLY